MSESSTLTRCPHCETRFRVTAEQLGVARGKVRCGHCLQVFNANDHRESPVPKSTSPSPVSGAASDDPNPDEDFIFEDDPDEDAASGNYAGGKTSFSEDELSDSFLAFDSSSGNSFNESTDEPEESVDESWAEAILANNRANAAANNASSRRATDDNPTAHEERPDQPDTPPESQETHTDDATGYPVNRDNHETAFSANASDDVTTSHSSESAASEAPVTREGSGVEEGLAVQNTESSPYENLRVDPINTHYPSQSGSNGGLSRIIWGVALVALIAVLIAQVTYFQVDRLSRIPELRPYYEQGCDLIGCKLPPLVAVDQIDSQKLVVRTHPDQRNMLVVDAVIVNRAAFAQPFPNIGLTFSNLNEDVVAQSLFEPDEYLSGDARNLQAMPSNKPFRISITIRDPGRDAVNYNIAFMARK